MSKCEDCLYYNTPEGKCLINDTAVPVTASCEKFTLKEPMKETTNEQGGVQHERPYMPEALQYKAIMEMAKVRYEACKVRGLDEDNWRNIPQREHIARAINHLNDAMAGNGRLEPTARKNLSHAMVRIGFALEMEIDKDDEKDN